MATEYFTSSDPTLLDLDFICRELAATYWAKGRSRSTIERAIQNSLVFGLYEVRINRQVGFARIVTDHATFGWLCDVIIDSTERRRGLGKILIGAIVADPRVANFNCLLGTRDAHGLYEKYGFIRQENMRRPGNNTHQDMPNKSL